MKDLESIIERMNGSLADLRTYLRRHAIDVETSVHGLEKALSKVQVELRKKALQRRQEQLLPVLKGRAPDYLKRVFGRQGWPFPPITKLDSATRRKLCASIPEDVSADKLAAIFKGVDAANSFDFTRMSLEQVRTVINRETDLGTLWEKLPPPYRPKTKPKGIKQLQGKAIDLVTRGREASGFHD